MMPISMQFFSSLFVRLLTGQITSPAPCHKLCSFYFYRVRPVRARIWLRHCATSRKIAVSIPDGVIGIFINVILSARRVRVFENWVLRRIFGPKRVRRNYIIRSLMICNSHQILLG